jgi:hypothetical protein
MLKNSWAAFKAKFASPDPPHGFQKYSIPPPRKSRARVILLEQNRINNERILQERKVYRA